VLRDARNGAQANHRPAGKVENRVKLEEKAKADRRGTRAVRKMSVAGRADRLRQEQTRQTREARRLQDGSGNGLEHDLTRLE
jgi:hypothetical protein